MNNFFKYLIVLVFVSQSTVCFLLFKTQQSQIRSEIKLKLKEGVPTNELAIFYFTDEELSQLEWKKSHEFRYKGKMYDVVRRIKHGSVTELQCVVDEQETELFETLDLMVGREMNTKDKNASPTHQVVKLISMPFLPTEYLSIRKNEFCIELRHYYSQKSTVGFGNCESPPPRS